MTTSQKESVKELANDASARFKKNARHIKEDAEGFEDKFKEVADEILHKGKEKLCNAKASFDEYSEEVVQSAKKHPVRSLFIAGAVGFALAAILLK